MNQTTAGTPYTPKELLGPLVDRPLLTVDEVADLLRSTPAAVRQRIKTGSLPAVKVAGRHSTRIPTRALLESITPYQPVA